MKKSDKSWFDKLEYDVRCAYSHLRKTDNHIPDESLDFIKDAAIEKVESMRDEARKHD